MKVEQLFEKVLKENSRDEFNKMQRQHDRDNRQTLAIGDLDDAMDSAGSEEYGFIRGFWRWSEDSHNWGTQIGDDIYTVVSYATDDNGVRVEIVECIGKNKEVLDSVRCSMDYGKVISTCKELSKNFDEYGMFDIED